MNGFRNVIIYCNIPGLLPEWCMSNMLSRGVTRAPYILNVTSSVYLYISFLPGRLQHFRLAAGGQARQHQHTKDTMMMFALLSIHNTYTHRFSSVTGILYGKSSLLTVLRSVLQVGQPKPSLKSSAAMTVHPIYIEFQYMNIIFKKIFKIKWLQNTEECNVMTSG